MITYLNISCFTDLPMFNCFLINWFWCFAVLIWSFLLFFLNFEYYFRLFSVSLRLISDYSTIWQCLNLFFKDSFSSSNCACKSLFTIPKIIWVFNNLSSHSPSSQDFANSLRIFVKCFTIFLFRCEKYMKSYCFISSWYIISLQPHKNVEYSFFTYFKCIVNFNPSVPNRFNNIDIRVASFFERLSCFEINLNSLSKNWNFQLNFLSSNSRYH